MKKTILLLSLFILIISLVYAEDSHVFIVNKYYLSEQPVIHAKSFFIEPIVSEQTIESCDSAEFSFKLSNPSINRLFKFSVSDFKGIIYYTQELIMTPNEARIISLNLQPDCNFRGSMNPKVIIETENERAALPLLLHVTGDTPLNEKDCEYFYNSTICGSSSYVKIVQGNAYEIELTDMFYDPDEDRLEYSAISNNLKIKIKENKAIIKPHWYFTGAQEAIFKAEDGKGGKAYSRTYYFHVTSNERSMLENFLIGNWIWLLIIVVLVLIILILLIFR